MKNIKVNKSHVSHRVNWLQRQTQLSRIINQVLCSSGNGVAGRYPDVCLSFHSPRASQGTHQTSAGCREVRPKRNKGDLIKVWGEEDKPLLKRRFRISHPLYLRNSSFSLAQLLAKTCHVQSLKVPLPKCMAVIKPPRDAIISFHIYRWCFNCCLNDIYLFIYLLKAPCFHSGYAGRRANSLGLAWPNMRRHCPKKQTNKKQQSKKKSSCESI